MYVTMVNPGNGFLASIVVQFNKRFPITQYMYVQNSMFYNILLLQQTIHRHHKNVRMYCGRQTTVPVVANTTTNATLSAACPTLCLERGVGHYIRAKVEHVLALDFYSWLDNENNINSQQKPFWLFIHAQTNDFWRTFGADHNSPRH